MITNEIIDNIITKIDYLEEFTFLDLAYETMFEIRHERNEHKFTLQVSGDDEIVYKFNVYFNLADKDFNLLDSVKCTDYDDTHNIIIFDIIFNCDEYNDIPIDYFKYIVITETKICRLLNRRVEISGAKNITSDNRHHIRNDELQSPEALFGSRLK